MSAPRTCVNRHILELFAGSLPDLRRLWSDAVRPALGSHAEAKVRRTAGRLFAGVTDTVREAAMMAAGRSLSPTGLREACHVGVTKILG